MLPEWEAIFDERTFDVFGLNLPPLSLGGLFLLQQIDSPLVTGTGAGATADDVLMATYLCARPHDDARRALRSPDVVRQWVEWGAAWGQRLGDDIAARARIVEEECTRFRDYLAHWLRAPKRWRKPDDTGAGTKTPWMVFLVSELRRHYGMTDAEAWAMPCAKAFAYYAAICEGHGDKDLVSDKEAAQIAAVTAQAAAAGRS
jgi:hypothetical protein